MPPWRGIANSRVRVSNAVVTSGLQMVTSEMWLLQSEVRLCMGDTHQISETKYKNNAKYLINSFCIDY